MNMDLPSSPGPSGSGVEEELDEAWNPIFLEEHEEGNKEDWADLAVSDDEDDVAEPTGGDPVPSQAPDPSIPLVVPWLPPRHNVVHWAPDRSTPMEVPESPPGPSRSRDLSPMDASGSPPRHWVSRDHTYARKAEVAARKCIVCGPTRNSRHCLPKNVPKKAHLREKWIQACV